MRHSFNHVVTSLVPELLGEDAPLNEIAETERRALEERRTSPREVRHYLYTNNTSESFNSTPARFEEELGGHFPSLRSLEVYLYVSIHE